MLFAGRLLIKDSLLWFAVGFMGLITGGLLILASMSLHPASETLEGSVDFLEMQWAVGISAIIIGLCMLAKGFIAGMED